MYNRIDSRDFDLLSILKIHDPKESYQREQRQKAVHSFIPVRITENT